MSERAGVPADGAHPVRRRRPPLRWLAAAVMLVMLMIGALTPVGRFLVRAAWTEGVILARRQPIGELVADPATAPATRAKLRLVLAARDFAADSLALDAGDSYTTYSELDRDTLVLVLSAAYRDRLERVTWWFPIVGRVPYKGYFDFARARDAAEGLERDELDVYLRPSAAFSTLGWFDDPLLSTVLGQDSLSLVNTVIHELTHNTFYAPSSAVFNESFANFVGAHGAAAFFRVRRDNQASAAVRARWADELTLGRFWANVVAALDSAYAAHPNDRATRIAAREVVYARARVVLRDSIASQLRTIDARWPDRVAMNNAALLARRIYLTELDLFEGVLAREGADLRRAVGRVIALARQSPDDPYGALRRWLASGGAEATAKERP